MYTKLGELKEAIDGESIVEIMKKFDLIEEKEPAISEKWKKYSKSIKNEDLNKPVKLFRNMESGSFSQANKIERTGKTGTVNYIENYCY